MYTNRGVFTHTVTASGGESSSAIEIGSYLNVSVQIVRTGATDTATVEVSNDKTNWVTAKDQTGTDIATLSEGIFNLGVNARYVRLTPSGSTDSFDLIACAPVEC